ncbi:hypothetical protein [Ligilactobacillus ruminis]|uniref:hypothetical protein n=1 Tax=Ligilactobacillus ruminis TaxID=1623 RepID=UPI0022E086C1|nr:hypothetical protein [Ligilactobacillus ruminis]
MISASAVATRHELIMSLVAGLNPIMQGVKPNAHDPVRKLWTTEGNEKTKLNFSRAFR